MKRLGWLVFAVVLIGLALAVNKGLYVGSTIDVSARQGADKLLFAKSCRYLHFDGVHGMPGGTETHSQEEAQSTSCALLQE